MNYKQKLKLYRKALSTFGYANQMDIAIEEMAELTKAVIKYRRDEVFDTIENVIEEIADVEIMIEQLRLMFDYENRVNEYRAEKLERLQSMFKDSDGMPTKKGKDLDNELGRCEGMALTCNANRKRRCSCSARHEIQLSSEITLRLCSNHKRALYNTVRLGGFEKYDGQIISIRNQAI